MTEKLEKEGCESDEAVRQTSPAGLHSFVLTLEPVPQLSSVVSMSVSGLASAGTLPFAHSCTQHTFLPVLLLRTPTAANVVHTDGDNSNFTAHLKELINFSSTCGRTVQYTVTYILRHSHRPTSLDHPRRHDHDDNGSSNALSRLCIMYRC